MKECEHDCLVFLSCKQTSVSTRLGCELNYGSFFPSIQYMPVVVMLYPIALWHPGSVRELWKLPRLLHVDRPRRQESSEGAEHTHTLADQSSLLRWMLFALVSYFTTSSACQGFGLAWLSLQKQVRWDDQSQYPDVTIESFVGQSSMGLFCPLLF